MNTFIKSIIIFSLAIMLGKTDLSAQNVPQDKPIYWASARSYDSKSSLIRPGYRNYLRLVSNPQPTTLTLNRLNSMKAQFQDPFTLLPAGMTMINTIYNVLQYGTMAYSLYGYTNSAMNSFFKGTEAAPVGQQQSNLLPVAYQETVSPSGSVSLSPIDHNSWTDAMSNNLINSLKESFPASLSNNWVTNSISAYQGYRVLKDIEDDYKRFYNLRPWRLAKPYGTTTAENQYIIDYFNKVKIFPASSNKVTVSDGTSAMARMVVDGEIVAQRIAVSSKAGETFENWADYVFEPDYDLRSISEVEAFIKENGHLPEVMSTEEVKEQGLDLVNMDITLLKKVEELTLYIIEQNKRIEQLEIQNQQINEIAEFKKRLEMLEKSSKKKNGVH